MFSLSSNLLAKLLNVAVREKESGCSRPIVSRTQLYKWKNTSWPFKENSTGSCCGMLSYIYHVYVQVWTNYILGMQLLTTGLNVGLFWHWMRNLWPPLTMQCLISLCLLAPAYHWPHSTFKPLLPHRQKPTLQTYTKLAFSLRIPKSICISSQEMMYFTQKKVGLPEYCMSLCLSLSMSVWFL